MDPIEAYIRQGAIQRGMDPDQAVRVAQSEGGFGASSYVGDQGSSFGPFQLHYGGMAPGGNAVSGLGDEFTKQTGLNANDPNTVHQQIDFSLDHAKQNGWGAWHGWKGDPWAGINAQAPMQAAMNERQPMPDNNTPVLFGGNPTPVGVLGGLARALGVGSEDDLGRRLQNGAAGLMAVGTTGLQGGGMGAANFAAVANQPHYNVAQLADGSRMLFDTRTGRPINVNGRPVGQQGSPQGDPNAPQDPSENFGLTPNAQNAYNENLAKESADEMQKSQEAYNAAMNTKALAAQARELVNNPDLSLGASGELRNDAKKYLKQYTGIDLGGVDQGDQFGTLAQTFAANQAKQMGVTRYAGPEIAMAARSSISENNTKEANLQHIADLEHLADRTIAQHAARVNYAGAHGGILGPGFSKYLDEVNKRTPTYELNPAMKTGGNNTGGPARVTNADDYNALSKGTQYLDPNGVLRTKQ